METHHLTKRQLGWLLLGLGALAALGVLAIDIVDWGREGGIGPSQQLALAACVVLALLGASLLPLGKRPA